ncbi:hypothetical protein BDK51DRAFT_50530 [Blyttiomyces helicus]|uniref:Uncharacterized protein n=1 Tax=Blyttiomyces helicus TaxID=388810 RepID=A0A4P9WHN5_9FUNG|nr:hypothetical protein BDK51DRAFT_50530 [Blyttiomyces helicus]|eukprot:RKO92254.1 hypothetical protein BDK51DRAFT_50530 [Blyttiomyces helicus]
MDPIPRYYMGASGIFSPVLKPPCHGSHPAALRTDHRVDSACGLLEACGPENEQELHQNTAAGERRVHGPSQQQRHIRWGVLAVSLTQLLLRSSRSCPGLAMHLHLPRAHNHVLHHQSQADWQRDTSMQVHDKLRQHLVHERRLPFSVSKTHDVDKQILARLAKIVEEWPDPIPLSPKAERGPNVNSCSDVKRAYIICGQRKPVAKLSNKAGKPAKCGFATYVEVLYMTSQAFPLIFIWGKPEVLNSERSIVDWKRALMNWHNPSFFKHPAPVSFLSTSSAMILLDLMDDPEFPRNVQALMQETNMAGFWIVFIDKWSYVKHLFANDPDADTSTIKEACPPHTWHLLLTGAKFSMSHQFTCITCKHMCKIWAPFDDRCTLIVAANVVDEFNIEYGVHRFILITLQNNYKRRSKFLQEHSLCLFEFMTRFGKVKISIACGQNVPDHGLRAKDPAYMQTVERAPQTLWETCWQTDLVIIFWNTLLDAINKEGALSFSRNHCITSLCFPAADLLLKGRITFPISKRTPPEIRHLPNSSTNSHQGTFT